MKKFKIINYIILLLTLTITSCTPGYQYPQDIIGLWKLSMIDNNAQIGCQLQSTFRFTNTELESIDFGENTSETCVVRAQQTYPYSINGSTLTLNTTPMETVEIPSIDATTLKLEQPDGSDLIVLTFIRQ